MKRKTDLNSDIDNIHESGNESESEMMKNVSETLPDAESESEDPISRLEAELTASNDKYLRLYSEFENYKRRVSKDRIEQTRMAASDIFLSLIPVIDDLERALKAMVDSKESNSVIEGVKLIYSKVKNIMSSKGLKEMESTGKPFDADLHDAIANVPVSDSSQKGMVMEEIEKGYFLNDKVIRHAKVIVGN